MAVYLAQQAHNAAVISSGDILNGANEIVHRMPVHKIPKLRVDVLRSLVDVRKKPTGICINGGYTGEGILQASINRLQQGNDFIIDIRQLNLYKTEPISRISTQKSIKRITILITKNTQFTVLFNSNIIYT